MTDVLRAAVAAAHHEDEGEVLGEVDRADLGRRRSERASSTSRSTSTRASVSSSWAAEKVSAVSSLRWIWGVTSISVQVAAGAEDLEVNADDTVTGTLKGYDQLLNLVMDDVVEEYESESARVICCSPW